MQLSPRRVARGGGGRPDFGRRSKPRTKKYLQIIIKPKLKQIATQHTHRSAPQCGREGTASSQGGLPNWLSLRLEIHHRQLPIRERLGQQ